MAGKISISTMPTCQNCGSWGSYVARGDTMYCGNCGQPFKKKKVIIRTSYTGFRKKGLTYIQRYLLYQFLFTGVLVGIYFWFGGTVSNLDTSLFYVWIAFAVINLLLAKVLKKS